MSEAHCVACRTSQEPSATFRTSRNAVQHPARHRNAVHHSRHQLPSSRSRCPNSQQYNVPEVLTGQYRMLGAPTGQYSMPAVLTPLVPCPPRMLTSQQPRSRTLWTSRLGSTACYMSRLGSTACLMSRLSHPGGSVEAAPYRTLPMPQTSGEHSRLLLSAGDSSARLGMRCNHPSCQPARCTPLGHPWAASTALHA